MQLFLDQKTDVSQKKTRVPKRKQKQEANSTSKKKNQNTENLKVFVCFTTQLLQFIIFWPTRGVLVTD